MRSVVGFGEAEYVANPGFQRGSRLRARLVRHLPPAAPADEGRHAADLKVCCRGLVLFGIEFEESYPAAEIEGGGGVVGRHHPAGAAPWRPYVQDKSAGILCDQSRKLLARQGNRLRCRETRSTSATFRSAQSPGGGYAVQGAACEA